ELCRLHREALTVHLADGPRAHWASPHVAASVKLRIYELRKIPARAIAESRRGKKSLCSQLALTCDAQPLAAIRDAIGAQIYLSLTVLRDQGRSIHHSSGTSHNASEPGKLHSRARLRDLDLAWLRTWPGRSALSCCCAGSLDGR